MNNWEEGTTPQPPVPEFQKKRLLVGIVLTVAGVLLFLGTIFLVLIKDLPQIKSLAEYNPALVTQIWAEGDGKNRTLVAEYYKERRYLVSYTDIPKKVVQAFLAAEDDQFFQHQGISFMAILRASFANFRAGQVVQGGSTITQQVAKSLFLSPERSLIRKIREVVMAYRLESNLSKEDILALYLNQIYLGAGAYGVVAAVKVYFNKNLKDITLAEAALLAGMTQAPSKYHPISNPKRVKERQHYVLSRMKELTYISDEEFKRAEQEKIRIYEPRDPNTRFAPYWMEHIRRHLATQYGEKKLYEEGLQVSISVPAELMRKAGLYLKEGLREFDKRKGYRGPLKKLKQEQEQKDFLTKSFEQLKLMSGAYTELLPDSSLQNLAAEDLLNDVDVYEGLVMRVSDRERNAVLGLAGLEVKMPFEKMEWARPFSADPKAITLPPKNPSQVLEVGDVVKVKVRREGPTWVASLEQEPEVQGALFSMDARTGYVLGMEGGYDFKSSEFNRAVQAQRQPGSAFKPLIFSSALEKGYTAASIVVDAPIVYKDEEFGNWKPTNFGDKFFGDTTFRLALINSRNIPTIKIVQDIQVPYVIEYAKRLGFVGSFSQDLSISLGSASTSLAELTQVYSLFPRLGRKVNPIYYTKIMDHGGNLLEEKAPDTMNLKLFTEHLKAPPREESDEAAKNPLLPTFAKFPLENDPAQVMDPRVAYVITHLLKEVISFGTGQRAKTLGRPAAGKTGTTNDYKDAWFLGFTPYVVTGVWVGFDDQRLALGAGETGSRAAVPIWVNFMKDAAERYPNDDFTVPPGVTFAAIDPKGQLVNANTADARQEAFIEGTEPKRRLVPTTPSSVDTEGEFLKEDYR